MQCEIVCRDGSYTCSKTFLEQYSSILTVLFRDCCQCEATVLVPNLSVNNVSVAISVLDMYDGNVCLEKELEESLGPVFSLLSINYSIRNDSTGGVLDPTTGALQVRKNVYSILDLCIHFSTQTKFK